jgi:hypothetical protein
MSVGEELMDDNSLQFYRRTMMASIPFALKSPLLSEGVNFGSTKSPVFQAD